MKQTAATETEPNIKFYRLLLLSCWLFYMVSMSVKNVYNAQIIQIIQDFETTKASASLSTTFYFFTYAAAQLALVKVLPKLNMRNYLLLSMGLSAVTNVLIVFCTEIWQIWLFFAITGFLQAGLWPCCILSVSKYLPISMHSGATTLLSTGFAGGMGMAYCLAALFLHIASWRLTVWMLNIAMLIFLGLFYYLLTKADRYTVDHPENPVVHAESPEETVTAKRQKKETIRFFSLLIIPCFFTHVAFYGIYNWVPSLLFDVFHLPTSLSTLLTVFLPICAVAGPLIGHKLCMRIHYWKVCFWMTFSSVIAAVALFFLYGVNMWLSLLLSLVFVVSVRGVSNIESAVIPIENRDFLNVGSSAAMLNAVASIGAAISPPVVGRIMDASPQNGRPLSYLLMVVASVFVLIFTQLGYRFSKQHTQNTSN